MQTRCTKDCDAQELGVRLQVLQHIEAQSVHLRALEDRAYGEVDRVRQELKALTVLLQSEKSCHNQYVEELRASCSQARKDLATATQQLGSEQARCEVLEQRSESARAQAHWRETEDGLRQGLEEARVAAATAEREAAAHRARADALAQQVATLGDLPAVVRASLAETPKKRGGRQGAAGVAKTTTRQKPLAGRAHGRNAKTP